MIGKVLISVGSLILAYSAYCHRDYVRYKIRIDANAHSDALLTYEVLVQAVLGFALVLLGLLYNLRVRTIKTGADVKGKTFVETFAENDYTVFNSRRKHLLGLGAKNNKVKK